MVQYQASQATQSVVVQALVYTTALTISTPASTPEDSPFNVTGRLTYVDGGMTYGLTGRNISVKVDGVQQVVPVTDGTGNYTASLTIGASGSHVVSVSFTAETYYSAATAQATVTVTELVYATALTLSAPTSITQNAPFTISGRLTTTAGGLGVDGMTITLVYDGTSFGTALTSGGGYYSKSVMIGSVGTYTLKATFAGVTGLGASESSSEMLIGETMGIAPLLAIGLIGAILFGGKL